MKQYDKFVIFGAKELFILCIPSILCRYSVHYTENSNGSIQPPWLNLNYENFGHPTVVVTETGLWAKPVEI